LLDQIFQTDFLLMSNGKPIGWSRGASRRVETTLWMIMALSHALKRREFIALLGGQQTF
jgi:hypothetical protein